MIFIYVVDIYDIYFVMFWMLWYLFWDWLSGTLRPKLVLVILQILFFTFIFLFILAI